MPWRAVAALGAVALLCGIVLFRSAVPAGADPISDCGAAAVNLVANCGFEAAADSNDQPTSWQTTNATNQWDGVEEYGHSGRYKYAFDNYYQGDSQLSQTIAVRPNWTYTLSFWLSNTAYTNFRPACSGNCIGNLEVQISNTTLGTSPSYNDPGFATFDYWYDYADTSPYASQGRFGWTGMSYSFTTAANASSVTVRFLADAVGTPWSLDDVVLAPQPTSTNTSLAVSPFANYYNPGSAVRNTVETLTAYVTWPNSYPVPGSVQLKDGSTNLGQPVPLTVDAGAHQGTASLSWTLPVGVHSLIAVFTPSDPGYAQGSSGGPVSFTVYNTATTTHLTVVPTTAIIHGVTPVTMTATVSPLAASGTVQFWGTGNPYTYTPVALGPPVKVVAGLATRVSTLPAGTWAVMAQFTPTNPTGYGPSSQSVKVTVS